MSCFDRVAGGGMADGPEGGLDREGPVPGQLYAAIVECVGAHRSNQPSPIN